MRPQSNVKLTPLVFGKFDAGHHAGQDEYLNSFRKRMYALGAFLAAPFGFAAVAALLPPGLRAFQALSSS